MVENVRLSNMIKKDTAEHELAKGIDADLQDNNPVSALKHFAKAIKMHHTSATALDGLDDEITQRLVAIAENYEGHAKEVSGHLCTHYNNIATRIDAGHITTESMKKHKIDAVNDTVRDLLPDELKARVGIALRY